MSQNNVIDETLGQLRQWLYMHAWMRKDII